MFRWVISSFSGKIMKHQLVGQKWRQNKKTKNFWNKACWEKKGKKNNEKSYIFVMIQCSIITLFYKKTGKHFISDDCLTGYCVNSAKCILHMIIQVKHFETQFWIKFFQHSANWCHLDGLCSNFSLFLLLKLFSESRILLSYKN